MTIPLFNSDPDDSDTETIGGSGSKSILPHPWIWIRWRLLYCIQIHDKMNILSLRIVLPSVTYFCFWKKITLTNSQQMGKVNGKLGSAQNKEGFYSCLFSLFSQATSVCWKSTENRMTTHLREQERVGEVCLTGEQPVYKVIRLYITECTMIRF